MELPKIRSAEENADRKIIKCHLTDIIKNDIDYSAFVDCIKRANNVNFICSYFIRSYLLYCFNENIDLPYLNEDFITMAYKVISIKTCGPLPKNQNKLIYDKLCEYYNNHYIKIINDNTTNTNGNSKCNSLNLSYVINLSSKEMITAYTNNIRLNFFKYVHQFIKQTFLVPFK
jgi:hypothetical protein